MVRFPWVWRWLSAAVLRLLRPNARLRRGLIRRETMSAYAAASRRDYALMLVRYASDVEFHFAPELEALGLGDAYRGHNGMLKLIGAFDEAWEQVEFEPAMMVDMGDRLLGLGRLRLRGTASGLETQREYAQLMTWKGGAIRREHDFLSWSDGLQAADLEPAALGL